MKREKGKEEMREEWGGGREMREGWRKRRRGKGEMREAWDGRTRKPPNYSHLILIFAPKPHPLSLTKVKVMLVLLPI